MEIIINTNESNASLWLSIISLIVASFSFLIPYFRPHIISKKKYWVSLDNKFSLDDYYKMTEAIKKGEYYLHYISKFRTYFCDFSNFNSIEGFFIFKISKKIEENKDIYSSIILSINDLENNKKEALTYNDKEISEKKKKLIQLSLKGEKEYLKLKLLLTRFPCNL